MTSISIDKCDQCGVQIPKESKTAIHIFASMLFHFGIYVGQKDVQQFNELDFCDQKCLCNFIDNFGKK